MPIPLLSEASEALASIVAEPPRAALVLGSGLGDFVDQLHDTAALPFDEVPGLPASTIAGHAGRFVFGRAAGAPVVVMQGRVHLYEGHGPAAVVHGVRAMARTGAKTLLLTNAAGGVDPDMAPGDLMLIRDHLNLTGRNCLVGPNDETVGPRFPDMSEVYDRSLADRVRAEASRIGIVLREGVYAGLLGPSYETPAEVRMLGQLGAHAVGMSTVLEAIAARHMGVRVLGISCITNAAAGLSNTPLSHAEVQQTAAAARTRFCRLLLAVIEALPPPAPHAP